jgi:hypothetical protein
VQRPLAGGEACCLPLFFPHLADLHIDKIEDWESLAVAPPGSSPLPWPSPRTARLGSPSMSNDAAGFAARYGPLSCFP